MKKIKAVSLFSGVGGFEYAANEIFGERMEVVFASEYERKTAEAYKVLHGIDAYNDIRDVDEREIKNHDILFGGFPCQPVSYSGKKRGFEDERGAVFFDLIRVAKYHKPKIIFLENVKGLISHNKGETVEVILESLSEIGYCVDFDLINSSGFGSPQNRERIYIVALREDLVKKDSEWGKKNKKIKKLKEKMDKNKNIKTFEFNFPKGKQEFKYIKDILEDDISEEYYLTSKKYTKYDEKEIVKDIKELVKKTRKNIEIGVKVQENYDIRPHRMDQRKSGLSELNINNTNNFSFTITVTHVPKIYGKETDWRVRKMTAMETIRLQTFPEVIHKKLIKNGFSNNKISKMMGNAITVNVAKEIFREIEKLI